ncbi:hypothetical protein TNIN_49411 [Trichonephila inaurata madagascariensis]|uniref:Uncharacterized protein n=1 Tax=Trichonephila inaurata madagascariensis TaxID=2747483 RepID=A0A8X6X7X6_9ARAC|nr:hypothetical protein TNIN_49411 [Trichonephila inaurata madagascariensis]
MPSQAVVVNNPASIQSSSAEHSRKNPSRHKIIDDEDVCLQHRFDISISFTNLVDAVCHFHSRKQNAATPLESDLQPEETLTLVEFRKGNFLICRGAAK